jgi:hypothetical protein
MVSKLTTPELTTPELTTPEQDRGNVQAWEPDSLQSELVSSPQSSSACSGASLRCPNHFRAPLH